MSGSRGGADADGDARATVRTGFGHGFTHITGAAIRAGHAVDEADPASRQLAAVGCPGTLTGIATRDGAEALRKASAALT